MVRRLVKMLVEQGLNGNQSVGAARPGRDPNREIMALV